MQNPLYLLDIEYIFNVLNFEITNNILRCKPGILKMGYAQRMCKICRVPFIVSDFAC